MRCVYFYAPHFMGQGKRPPDYLLDVEREVLSKTWAGEFDVFCIPADQLVQPLPVGTVVKFGKVFEHDLSVDFVVTEIFTVADKQPDVVYMELQLKQYDHDSVDILLEYLRSKHDATGEYHYWG